MASTNDIILQQYNSSGNWDEKLITPESGKVLGFDASLNPVQLSKQDTLVSGSNIKTINGNSLLGSGNLVAGTPWSQIFIVEQYVSAAKVDMTSMSFVLQNMQYLAIKLFCYIGTSTTETVEIMVNHTQLSEIHASGGGKVGGTGVLVPQNVNSMAGTFAAGERIVATILCPAANNEGTLELSLMIKSRANNNTVKLVIDGRSNYTYFKYVIAEYMII